MNLKKKRTIAVHINDDGEIESIQRTKEPYYLRDDFPKWLCERVALVRLSNIGELIMSPFQARYINPRYMILYLSNKEYTEIGKLIGT